MGSLSSALNNDDLGILLEATTDWEALGNHDFHILNMVKSVQMPPENQETYEFVKNLKEHFHKIERDIRAARELRQEKAILLKAKLMLIKRDLSINQLFDDAHNNSLGLKLQQAEAFIESLGVTSHYKKYLDDNKLPSIVSS